MSGFERCDWDDSTQGGVIGSLGDIPADLTSINNGADKSDTSLYEAVFERPTGEGGTVNSYVPSSGGVSTSS
ncbi:MAG: hypothetical protein Q9182_005751 [Xanthomendoza sp. 2 TL-2023]